MKQKNGGPTLDGSATKRLIFELPFIAPYINELGLRSDFFQQSQTYLRNYASKIGLVYHFNKVWWRRMSLKGPFYNQGQIWPPKMALKIQSF